MNVQIIRQNEKKLRLIVINRINDLYLRVCIWRWIDRDRQLDFRWIAREIFRYKVKSCLAKVRLRESRHPGVLSAQAARHRSVSGRQDRALPQLQVQWIGIERQRDRFMEDEQMEKRSVQRIGPGFWIDRYAHGQING